MAHPRYANPIPSPQIMSSFRYRPGVRTKPDVLSRPAAIPEVAKPVDLTPRGGCWFGRGLLKVHLGLEESFCRLAKPTSCFRRRRSAGTGDVPARRGVGWG